MTSKGFEGRDKAPDVLKKFTDYGFDIGILVLLPVIGKIAGVISLSSRRPRMADLTERPSREPVKRKFARTIRTELAVSLRMARCSRLTLGPWVA